MLEENEATTPEETPLNADLKLKWAKCRLLSSETHSFANSAMRPNAHSLYDLSNVGSFGENASNLLRDQKKAIRHSRRQPTHGLDRTSFERQSHGSPPNVLPHCFSQSLAADMHDIWLNRVRGLSGAAAQFGRQLPLMNMLPTARICREDHGIW